MSEFDLKKPEGPPRALGARAVRPRLSASIILLRRDGRSTRVLMGRRHGRHSFMPNLWVFPGGRVERADSTAPAASDLSSDTAALFAAHLTPSRGRAVALAAVRETFEETGLLLARPAPPRSAAGPWREFLGQGALPDLEALQIVARAVTPPMIAKRFDTWFFQADAERLISLDRRADCGELEEIAWPTIDGALALNLPQITRAILLEAVARAADPERPRPFLRYVRGGMRSSPL